MKNFKDLVHKIKNHKGLSAKEITNDDKEKIEIIGSIIVGLLFSLGSIWFLIFKFQIFQAPGLMKHFPQVYILMFSLLLSGVFIFIKGILKLKKRFK